MADYKLISADSHVNEVSATWERVRRKYADRAPEIVWNPSEHEHGPYLSIRDWETSLEGKNRESCAMEFVGMVIGGLGVGSRISQELSLRGLAWTVGAECAPSGYGPRRC